MKAYIISLITVTLICSVASALLPDDSGLHGHLRLISALCVICVMIKPTADVIVYIRDFSPDSISFPREDGEEYESVFEEYMSGAQTELLRDEIRARLVSKFGGDKEDYSVYISSGQNGISQISVFLSGDAAFADGGEIERYLSTFVGCKVICGVG